MSPTQKFVRSLGLVVILSTVLLFLQPGGEVIAENRGSCITPLGRNVHIRGESDIESQILGTFYVGETNSLIIQEYDSHERMWYRIQPGWVASWVVSRVSCDSGSQSSVRQTRIISGGEFETTSVAGLVVYNRPEGIPLSGISDISTELESIVIELDTTTCYEGSPGIVVAFVTRAEFESFVSEEHRGQNLNAISSAARWDGVRLVPVSTCNPSNYRLALVVSSGRAPSSIWGSMIHEFGHIYGALHGAACLAHASNRDTSVTGYGDTCWIVRQYLYTFYFYGA